MEKCIITNHCQMSLREMNMAHYIWVGIPAIHKCSLFLIPGQVAPFLMSLYPPIFEIAAIKSHTHLQFCLVTHLWCRLDTLLQAQVEVEHH